MVTQNLALIGQSVSEKIFEIVDNWRPMQELGILEAHL